MYSIISVIQPVFVNTHDACQALAAESGERLGGWNPIVPGAMAAIEEAIEDLRGNVLPKFAAVRSESDAPLSKEAAALMPLLLAGLKDASRVMRQVRKAYIAGRESDQAHLFAEEAREDIHEQILWTAQFVEGFQRHNYSESIEFEALDRMVPEELIWAFLDLRESVAHCVEAMTNPRVDPVRYGSHSIELAARAREHGHVAIDRMRLRRKIDDETAALLRRIRWPLRKRQGQAGRR